ncbi:MAG: hypothetical protein ETSY1_46760 (plasmid) [Candidatus Entotheonella factor]|uniref:Uncharacterized protein n=1 Tax=Entotheonella factor TaxID=1429438 RepID=W4M0R3_ENTF1|nr:MAG: hypothetical protein ETSY1_46760 [Candidatus Entotheonella factor]
MPLLSRTWDMTLGIGSHGLPCCPHVLIGYRSSGSSDVEAGDRGASRAFVDIAQHTCPHCAVNLCVQGSADVVVNGQPAHRLSDGVTEFCGWGITHTASPDVSANGG